MKLNKYSWLAVLPMIFTACQDDTLVENQQQDKIYTLSATMDGDAAMSRAQIQLGNSDANAGEIFFWNEGDSFTLYQEIDGNHSEHIFRINGYSEDGDGDKKLANFVTNNPAAVGSAVAFYPSGLVTDFDGDSKRVSLQLQTTVDFSKGTVEEVWKDYFNDNMLMRAQATLTENNENTLEFEHLLSLARITYQNESGKDQQVTEIKLGGDQTYGYAPTVWLDYGWIGGQLNNGYGITYENLIVKAGESFDFYILFGPEKFADGDMHIHIHTAQTDGNRSPLTLPTSTIAAANNDAEGFEAGKRYWFKVTETGSGLTWSSAYKEKSIDVGTFDALVNAVNDESITHIKLTNPLVISERVDELDLKDKIITLSETFEWNGENALFVNTGERLGFYNVRIEGEETEAEGKYLISSTAGELYLNCIKINAYDKMNGIKLENSSTLYLYGNENSYINVEGNYAFSISSSETKKSDIWIDFNGEIEGNVYYRNDYVSPNDPSNFKVGSGTIIGDLNIEGSQPYLWVEIQENASTDGEGWNQDTITIANNNFTQLLCNDYYYFVTRDENYVYVNKAFAESLPKLELEYKGLSDLSGINAFKGLTELNCNNNDLTSLDLSSLTNLKTLKCNDNNNLNSLILPVGITHIECENNSLRELDLTLCTSESIYILCGRQGDSTGQNLTLTLKLSEAMKTYWKSELCNEGNNGVRVKIDGDTSIQAPSLENNVW